jgi:hypothetical protein
MEALLDAKAAGRVTLVVDATLQGDGGAVLAALAAGALLAQGGARWSGRLRDPFAVW